MTSSPCTGLGSNAMLITDAGLFRDGAGLRASRADARRLVLRVDGPGAARETTADAQLAFVEAARCAAFAVDARCAGRGDDGEAPAGLAVRVAADGWLDLLVPALRAPPGRLRPAQGYAAAALRRVCCAAAASPSAVLAVARCGAVAALVDCAIHRGEDAPAPNAKADAARALAALARDPGAACHVAIELLTAGALAIGAGGAADWTPRVRAPRGAAGRDAFAALLGAVGHATGGSSPPWRAPLLALAAADARGDAEAPTAGTFFFALCDAVDSVLATGPPSHAADVTDDGAATVASLVVAGAVDALVRALADARTAAPVRARVAASLAAIAPRLLQLEVVWRALPRAARPVIVYAPRVAAADAEAAARDAVGALARGEAQLWALFATAIQTNQLIAGRSDGDDDAASIKLGARAPVAADESTTRVDAVDEGAVCSWPPRDHGRGEAQDDQKHTGGKNKPFVQPSLSPPPMSQSSSDGDNAPSEPRGAALLPHPTGPAPAAPTRVNPKLKAPGARAPSDAYCDQTARRAPAPFGSLVGDYGAVPAYAAAPSPPMREVKSDPRAASPPDGTSVREALLPGTRLALGSLRGRSPRVVVDTVDDAACEPSKEAASPFAGLQYDRTRYDGLVALLTSLDLAGRADLFVRNGLDLDAAARLDAHDLRTLGLGDAEAEIFRRATCVARARSAGIILSGESMRCQ